MIFTWISSFLSINELKMIVKTNTTMQNAMLLFHANFLKQSLPQQDIFLRILDDPRRFQKDELENFLCIMIDINQSFQRYQMSKSEQYKSGFHMNGNVMRQIMEPLCKAFLPWEATICAGFSKKNFNEMHLIWGLLSQSIEFLPLIIKNAKEADDLLGGDSFIMLSEQEMLEIAKYIPSAFR